MKIKSEGQQLLSSKDTEAVLLEEIKQSIEECTADEFHVFMAMLAATSMQKSVSGQSMIVELIAISCQLEKGIFDPNDEETVDRLLQCANAAIPFFSVSLNKCSVMAKLAMTLQTKKMLAKKILCKEMDAKEAKKNIP